MVNKHRLYWTLQIGGWMMYFLVQIVFSIVASGVISLKRCVFFFLEALICLLGTHLYRSFINKDHWLSMPMAKLIPRIVASVFMLGLVIYFLKMPISLMLGFFDSNIAFNFEKLIVLTSVYAFIFFLWSVLYFTYHYFERYNKSLKYEASMIEIELTNLRSQLNPHFIFNALNSIRALVDENPKKSKQAINHLSNILRKSLSPGKQGLTKFGDELRVVQDYLGLESIRFEERLRTEFIIDPASFQYYVPPLMIQTLVENGIKHGISRLKAGGIIKLSTVVRKEFLIIQIRNSGQLANHSKPIGSGLGIKNTVQRLKLIYGEKSSFTIANESNTFVLTEIIIPYISSFEASSGE